MRRGQVIISRVSAEGPEVLTRNEKRRKEGTNTRSSIPQEEDASSSDRKQREKAWETEKKRNADAWLGAEEKERWSIRTLSRDQMDVFD